MAKKPLITINGAYHKIKKGFVTVDNRYRKIKKAFVTVGGVYRPFWSGGKLVYHGTGTSLQSARTQVQGATIGSYAIFAGGALNTQSSGRSAQVDVYDRYLTHTTLSDVLSAAVARHTSASSSTHAIFAGGMETSSAASTSVTAYNASLTRTIPASALTSGRYYPAATSIDANVLIAGGHKNASTFFSTVELYDGSLTHISGGALGVLSTERGRLSGARAGNYAVFAGGLTASTTSSKVVDCFDASGTKITSSAALKATRAYMGATTFLDHAIFAGGRRPESTGWQKYGLGTVEVFSPSLTRTDLSLVGTTRELLAAASTREYAVFAGGEYDTRVVADVDYMDASMTITKHESALSSARSELGSATVGDYIIFAGGENIQNNSLSVVDVFAVK